MKERYLIVVFVLAVLMLTACSDLAKSNLTQQQVIEKAIERQQLLKNVHAVFDMTQQMDMIVDGVTVQFSTSSDLAMELQQNPMTMYTKGTVVMEMEDESMAMPMEMYMSESKGFYLLTGEDNQWTKIPNSEYEQVAAQTGTNTDPATQLKQLKSFIDDFEFEQNDTSYLLTLHIEGDKFKDWIVEQLGAVIQGTAELTNETVEAMTFKDSKYELVINKDTFDTNEIHMNITILMDVEGQQAQIINNTSIIYSKFDELNEITVPKELMESLAF